MDADLLERLAEHVHKEWMAEKQRQGFADHVLVPVPCACNDAEGCPARQGCNQAYCRLPAYKHHTDMLPYAELAENVKEYDRATVRGVLRALDKEGFVILQRSPDAAE
jgi:DNA-binding transcriptional ArsR family regulator